MVKVRSLKGDTVRKRIADVRELLAQQRQMMRDWEDSAFDEIAELRRRCSHEQTSTSAGTPYDRGETSCDDCGATVRGR